MVVATASVFAAGHALSAIAQVVAGIYGMGKNLNVFLDKHIQEMQASPNVTIATTGRILERAKYGFGLGYLSSVTIIAVGQFLLGNPLTALTTLGSAAVLSNPIAMTCGAVGAIVYGWGALSDAEQADLLDKLSRGLEVGAELIRSIIAFVIQTAKELFDSKLFKALQEFVSKAADPFGRTLADVTHSASDLVREAAVALHRHAGEAFTSTVEGVGKVAEVVGDAAGSAFERTGAATRRVVRDGKAAVQRARPNQHPR